MRRDNLDALPFDDYADPDPHGQLRIDDETPERCRDHAHGTWGLGELFDQACPAHKAARP